MTLFTATSMRGFQNTKAVDLRQHPRPAKGKGLSAYPKRSREITGTHCLGSATSA